MFRITSIFNKSADSQAFNGGKVQNLPQKVVKLEQSLQDLRDEIQKFKTAAEFNEISLTDANNLSAIADSKANLAALNLEQFRNRLGGSEKSTEEKICLLRSELKKMADEFCELKENKTASDLSSEQQKLVDCLTISALAFQVGALKDSEEQARQRISEIENTKDAEIAELKIALENAVSEKSLAETEVLQLRQENDARRCNKIKEDVEERCCSADSGFLEAEIKARIKSENELQKQIAELQAELQICRKSLCKQIDEKLELEQENEKLRSDLENYAEVFPGLVHTRRDVIEAAVEGDMSKLALIFSMYQQPPMSRIINAKDPETGNTPLMLASGLSHIQFLISRGADVNARNLKGESAAIRAASAGHVGIFKELVKAGAEVIGVEDINGNTALMKAAENGHQRIVEYLLTSDKVEDCDCEVAVNKAFENGHESVVDLFVEYGHWPDSTDE